MEVTFEPSRHLKNNSTHAFTLTNDYTHKETIEKNVDYQTT